MSESKLLGRRMWMDASELHAERVVHMEETYRKLQYAPVVVFTDPELSAHIEAKERAAWDAAATDDEFEKITFETWKESQK